MLLYIECKMGAAGDVLMSALYELLSDTQKKKFVDTMNSVFGNDVQIQPEAKSTCGIKGTHIHVLVHNTEEGCDHIFALTPSGRYRCIYCEQEFRVKP